nr:MAG TPA: hypothetical protein [Caudoviricetes sp.]
MNKYKYLRYKYIYYFITLKTNKDINFLMILFVYYKYVYYLCKRK